MRARLVSKSLALVWLALHAGASFAVAEKSIQAVRTEIPPKIDGFIESVWAKVDSVTEFVQIKPNGSVEKTSWISHPILNWALSRDMNLRVWSEPNTDTHIHRLNVLFSWNFKPKSWFYLAFNESRDNTEGDWIPKDRIIVAKVRYLFLL